MSRSQMWAIVRIDHYLEDLVAEEGGPERSADQLVSVTRFYYERDTAVREVARLSTLQDPSDIEYFTTDAEVCSNSLGPEPAAVVGVTQFRPGARVSPEQVRIGGVWESAAAARQYVSRLDDNDTVWGIRKARIRSAQIA